MWSAVNIVMAFLVLATALEPFWNESKSQTVVCPDASTECPDKNTCCPKKNGYNCCPITNASCCGDDVHCCFSNYPVCCSDGHCCPSDYKVCCSDGSHCCPDGNRCDGSTCVPPGSRHGEKSVAAVLGMKPYPRKDGKLKAVVCPDGSSQCNDGHTCCMLSSGKYGCCPILHANCCADKIHCCPGGYTCEADNCSKEGGTVHPMMEQLLSPVPHKEV